jgi:hypothetical protein
MVASIAVFIGSAHGLSCLQIKQISLAVQACSCFTLVILLLVAKAETQRLTKI